MSDINVYCGPGQSYSYWTPRDHCADEQTCERIGQLIMRATRGLQGVQNQIDQARARPMKVGDLMDLINEPSRMLVGIDMGTLESARTAIAELGTIGIESVADLTEMHSAPSHVTLVQLRVRLAEIEAQFMPFNKFAKRKGAA